MLNISATLDTGNNNVSCPKPSFPTFAIWLSFGKDLRLNTGLLLNWTIQLADFRYDSPWLAGAPTVNFSMNKSVVRALLQPHM
jgi:hypothetical protein